MQILEFFGWGEAIGACWLEQPEEFQDYLLADNVVDLRDDSTGALQHARGCGRLAESFPPQTLHHSFCSDRRLVSFPATTAGPANASAPLLR